MAMVQGIVLASDYSTAKVVWLVLSSRHMVNPRRISARKCFEVLQPVLHLFLDADI